MLIAFEGLDQSGKETQARQLAIRLRGEGHTVQALSFPDYETPLGQEIRKALAGSRDFGPEVMQLLYVANRFEHRLSLERWIEQGAFVICDRYRASSVAYGEAQGLSPEWLELIQRGLPAASLTVLLDIGPEAAAARKPDARDRFERDMALLARVRQSYLRQAAAADGWIVVDADRPKDAVTSDVTGAVLSRLGRR